MLRRLIIKLCLISTASSIYPHLTSLLLGIQHSPEFCSLSFFFLIAQQLYMSLCCLFVCFSHPIHIQTLMSMYTPTNQTKLKSILMDLIWLKLLRNSCTVLYLFVPSDPHMNSQVHTQTHKPDKTKTSPHTD